MTIETIRVLKTFQTQALTHGLALEGVLANSPAKELAEQVTDAVVTSNNHAAALGHVIKVLTNGN